LAPEDKVEKKQAPGFRAAAAAERAQAPPEVGKTAPERTGPEGSHARDSKRMTTPTRIEGWPAGKQLLKIALVVAATALSVYLLRRRLL
jgi:hypothetical protein